MHVPCSQVILKPLASVAEIGPQGCPFLFYTVQWVSPQEVLDSHSMVQHGFEVRFGVCRRMIILQRFSCGLETLEVVIQFILPGRLLKPDLSIALSAAFGETVSIRINAAQKVFQVLFGNFLLHLSVRYPHSEHDCHYD